ncbi:MAG: DNA repair protein RadA [Firmicutes bacterium HGW-Firmicutes-12]|nr:MAG: DNA repair protein RadA [Firmicutes bacterium HGW-Firmicutes-12]
MVRQKSKYVCQRCGIESLRWLGRCPECDSWNCFVEELEKSTKYKKTDKEMALRPEPLFQVQSLAIERLNMGMSELNRVLGGGLVPGTVVLIAGDPGIGKSTLLLQAAAYVASREEKVLYISGEESAQQIKLRAARMGLGENKVLVWAETDMDVIAEEIKSSKPTLVIIDSIQTVHTTELGPAPGSIGQIREGTARLIAIAKEFHIPVIIVGHVTKDGNIAGPRVLEHMVDTVLYFEGERHYQYRILRAIKNRFGSTFELGVFEMKNEGLEEILNPSVAFLAERPFFTPGSVVAACMEGSRPLLVEIQALVTKSSFGQPRRMTTGIEFNRANLILAVLEKRVGLNIAGQDVYLNIAGGIKVQEPALDLAIAIAVSSSLRNQPCPVGLAVMGEIGLTGEIRGVSHLQKRLQEAKKLGFSHCLVPYGIKHEKVKDIQVLEVKTLSEALEATMG